MKPIQYFSHDINSRNDEKLVELSIKHGLAGIGAYWCIVEMMYEQGGIIEFKCERIAFALHTDSDFINDILTGFNLFENDTKKVWSNSVLSRIDDIKNRSNGAKKAANERWKRNKDAQPNANALHTDSERITSAMPIKEKKRKEKKNKVKEIIYPSEQEVIDYFIENGFNEIGGRKAFNHYYPEWTDSKGNRVINWKQKIRTNWFQDQYKIISTPQRRQPYPEHEGF